MSPSKKPPVFASVFSSRFSLLGSTTSINPATSSSRAICCTRLSLMRMCIATSRVLNRCSNILPIMRRLTSSSYALSRGNARCCPPHSEHSFCAALSPIRRASGATVPRCHGATVPRCQGERCHGAHSVWSPGQEKPSTIFSRIARAFRHTFKKSKPRPVTMYWDPVIYRRSSIIN